MFFYRLPGVGMGFFWGICYTGDGNNIQLPVIPYQYIPAMYTVPHRSLDIFYRQTLFFE